MNATQCQRHGRCLHARPGRVAWALLAPLLLTGACDRSSPRSATGTSPSGPTAEQALIAFVGAGEADPLWPVLEAGAQRYADASAAVRIQCFSPARSSPQAQIETLRSLRRAGLRGLCVRVTDADALLPTLKQLHNRGIPIVSMIQPISRDIRAGHVGLNEAEIGKALADATLEVLDGGGSIALLHAGYEHPVYGPRRIAFEQEIRFQPEIRVFTKKDCGADPAKAREIMRTYSKRFPRLSAWVALGDWPLLDGGTDGDLGLQPGCRFVTFGGTPRQWPLIERGISTRIVAADYGELGARAVQYCEVALGEPSRFEKLYEAPLRIIRPADLDAYKADWHRWSAER